jgi:membrane dipeptidase
LAREILIVDTHIDVPFRLEEKEEDISRRTEGGDFDYVRARAGGLNVAFMSIYVPSELQETGGAKEKADALIDRVEGFAERWPEQFALARSTSEVRDQFSSEVVSLPLGLENGAPVEEDLDNLRHFYDRGIRYITLAHAMDNQLADSSYEETRTWGGLSPFGRKVVGEMNRLGMMVDVSHITDEAFHQVLEITAAPVIASHSSCRHFTPEWERNMNDEMIRALAGNGGVIQINFGSAFLTEEANVDSVELWDKVESYAEEHNLAASDERVEAYEESLYREDPPALADVSDVADHIDHVVGLVGVDHVGIGSDFDGVEPTTPTGLEDVSQLPNLIRVLLERGYTEDEIAKIFGGNTLRVWEEVEKIGE